MFRIVIAASLLAITASFGEVFGDLRVGENYVKELMTRREVILRFET